MIPRYGPNVYRTIFVETVEKRKLLGIEELGKSAQTRGQLPPDDSGRACRICRIDRAGISPARIARGSRSRERSTRLVGEYVTPSFTISWREKKRERTRDWPANTEPRKPVLLSRASQSRCLASRGARDSRRGEDESHPVTRTARLRGRAA